MDESTNRISTSGYTYDASGNMTNDSIHAYTYDAENRITSVDASGTYVYDGNGLRVQKDSTIYIYSGTKVIAEYASGALSREYVYSGSQLLATLDASGNPTYSHPDHLSTRVETDASGTTVRTYGHLPFGEDWYETGTANKLKFTTYERDSSGLDYAMMRYNSPRLGRFISPDLLAGNIIQPQSMNRYGYVTSDPINLVDPTGLLRTCSGWWGADPNEGGHFTGCQEIEFDDIFPSRDDRPRGGGSGRPTPKLPKYLCDPKVFQKIQDAYNAAHNAAGQTKSPETQIEAGFIVNQYDHVFSASNVKTSGQEGRLIFNINSAYAKAFIHTHLAGGALPSTTENASGMGEHADTLTARDSRLDVLVISENGLSIAPNTTKDVRTNKESIFLEEGLKFQQWFDLLKQDCGKQK